MCVFSHGMTAHDGRCHKISICLPQRREREECNICECRQRAHISIRHCNRNPIVIVHCVRIVLVVDVKINRNTSLQTKHQVERRHLNPLIETTAAVI